MRVLAAGSPGPRQTPPSTRFMTIVGQPKTIALKYATGRIVRSRYSGQDEMMYTLTTGEKAFFPMNVGAAIDSLTLAPGQPFVVCHHGGGNWDIDRAPGFPPPAPAPMPQPPTHPPMGPPAARTQRAPAPQPPHYWGSEAAPAATSPETDTPTPRFAQDHSNSAGNVLASFYPDAIEIALAGVAAAQKRGLMVAPTFEDVRCIATTLFIEHSGRNR
ncbi:MAG: hypothetical protein V4502_08160 [Pseudomonadota bacterium]